MRTIAALQRALSANYASHRFLTFARSRPKQKRRSFRRRENGKLDSRAKGVIIMLPPPLTKLISSRDTSAKPRSHLNTPTCTYAFAAATVKRETAAPKGHNLPLPVVSHWEARSQRAKPVSL